jgi:3-oxoacyl-[acyl-carrier-protein] synthase-3
LGIPTVGSDDLSNSEFSPNGHKMHKMYMNGSEVFKFATRVIADSIQEALSKADLAIDDVALIVPHQANLRIIQAAARSLKVEPDLFMSNLDRYGNTSAASIPIALCEAVQEDRVHEDDYIVFIGFGGGLTWATTVIQWGVPKPAERKPTNVINQRRRQLRYLLTRWQTQLRRILRRLTDTISRTRPKQGRILRLRERADRYNLD